MVDLAEMSLRREPDALIVHSGTNDFDAKINTKNQLQRVIAKARGKNADIKIGISAICLRVDRPEMKTKVKDMNNQLKNFCHQHQVTFIDHDDFDRSCLAAKGLHPNSNGNTSLYIWISIGLCQPCSIDFQTDYRRLMIQITTLNQQTLVKI